MGFLDNVGRAIGDSLARIILMKGLSSLKVGKLLIELPNKTTIVLDSGAPGPAATLQVLDNSFFRQFMLNGEIGFGEAYQRGTCDSPDMVALLSLAIENRRAVDLNKGLLRLVSRAKNIRSHRNRANTIEGSKENIHAHYDLGNDFFKLFLDESMTYSCALFAHEGESLADAQTNKYRRLCEIAGISENDRVLEIGTGWGGFAMFAARTFGCRVTTVTISKEQFDLAVERIEEANLADLISVELMDYRDITGEYDKIISIEMFEAVGVEYFETFFQKCSSLLRPHGKLAMQVITVPDSAFEAQKTGINWIQKYIFPGGVLPSLEEMERVNARTGLQLETSHDIGPDYARTLHQWRERFWTNMADVRAQGYDEYFIRTWDYYLAATEAGFLTGITGDIHVTFNKTS